MSCRWSDAGRVHLGRCLGQPKLKRDGVGRPAGTGRPLQAGDELVDGALGHADHGGREIPSRQASERHAIAEALVERPPGPLAVAGAVRIHAAVGGHEGILDDDVLAARSAHSRGEPRVDDLVARTREQQPAQLAGAGAGDGHHGPARRVAAAGKTPATGDPETAVHGLGLPRGRVEAAREERIRPAGEELLLGLLGEVPEPPVVNRPQGIAPPGRPAPSAQLPGHVERRVDLDAVTAVSTRVADPDEAGGHAGPGPFRGESAGAVRSGPRAP